MNFEPLARPDAPLARRNPVAKLAAALLFTFALMTTLDPVAPAIAIAVELAVLPLFGLHPRDLLRRAWPLLAGAGGILVTLLLFAADRSGRVLFEAGPVMVTSGVLLTALGLVLRLFAVALPGVIVFATTDPTDLADALVQNAKAPARFAIGALAAFRLFPLLGQEWQMITMARRARGVQAGRNPVARLRLFVSTAFTLLVGAIRRGTRLAVAMDARGFDAGVPRTFARRQHFGPADWLLIASAILLATALLTTTIALGTFRPSSNPPPPPHPTPAPVIMQLWCPTK
ncbi:ABC transporter [Micromonospora endophytica]|nr:ABC transporter [Micromonospora endophytica]